MYIIDEYIYTLTKPSTETFSFCLGDRDKFCLPDDVTILHAEFTYYYYPGDITFPCR